jgi:hypothetical protein
MPRQFLLESRCWFGGGTAIVLKLDEYRRSADVDFLCADQAGYRELRQAAQARGVAAFFKGDVTALREIRTDQYGIRTMLLFKGQTIKFEIVREARIDISGDVDPELGVPLLSRDDMFAEKLLANADRCMDRSVAYRDAIDLGMLISAHSMIPPSSLAKANQAYGADIEKKLVWSTVRLRQSAERDYARDALQMSIGDVNRAATALDGECQRLWPTAMDSAIGFSQPG